MTGSSGPAARSSSPALRRLFGYIIHTSPPFVILFSQSARRIENGAGEICESEKRVRSYRREIFSRENPPRRGNGKEEVHILEVYFLLG